MKKDSSLGQQSTNIICGGELRSSSAHKQTTRSSHTATAAPATKRPTSHSALSVRGGHNNYTTEDVICYGGNMKVDVTSRTEQAFEELYKQAYPQLVRYAMSLVGNTDMAKDLMQDAAVRGFRGFDGYRGGSFAGWMRRVVRTAHLDENRKVSDAMRYSCSYDAAPATQIGEEFQHWDAPAPVMEHELEWDIERIFAEMAKERSPEIAEATRLVVIEGLSYEEVVEIQGDSFAAIRSRIMRGKKYLRERVRGILTAA